MVKADQDIFKRGHLAEKLNVLERPGNTLERDFARREASQLLRHQRNCPAGRPVNAGQDVHHSALAGAVRTDQPMNAAWSYG